MSFGFGFGIFELEHGKRRRSVAAMANESEVVLVDGSVDFGGGVDSIKVPTVYSAENPGGLAYNESGWAQNVSFRDGGITPRPGFKRLTKIISSILFQGGYMYEPDNADPYLVFSFAGRIYSMGVDAAAPVLLSTTAALSNPPTIDQAFFCQGEQFLVIQAGDNTTLPLFWDGTILRRSNGVSINLGTTSGPFTAPALGKAVNIPVTTPPGFSGSFGQVFEVNGDTSAIYIYVNPAWNIGLTNISANATGTVKAGTSLYHYNGNFAAKFLAQFVIPALGGNDTTWLDRPYNGAVNDFVTIGGQLSIGTGGPPANNIIAVNTNQTPGTINPATVSLTSIQELGAASPMDYYSGRLWYGIGRQILAGDIVRGPSGTAFYDFRDSILKVTENPLCLAGDGFTVPDNAGNIRAIFHNGNINATLGQGNLYIGTRKQIYQLDVPVTRTDWIAAGNSNAPKMTVVQISNGPVNDRSVTKINGDVWFQNLEPNIASLFTTVRNFTQWGNISLSANEQRILQFNDRSLLRFSSGIYFNNYMIQTALPRRVAPNVIHDALVPMDIVPLSQFGATLNPTWLGHWQGVQIMQMWTGDFGGRERAFAAVVSTTNGDIELWEITVADKFDTQDNAKAVAAKITGSGDDGTVRLQCYVETPSYTFGDLNQLNKLVSAEIGIDRLFGTVEFRLDFQPDSDSCWHLWHEWKLCSAKNTCEEGVNTYPCVPLGEGYKQNITVPLPQEKCSVQSGRPLNVGYEFQARLTWHGFCRIRSIRLMAETVETRLYRDLSC
jgi:hypothetical protein